MKHNCAFCYTEISKGHFERQNGKCQRCHFYFPDSMPFQYRCSIFGCSEYAQMGEEFCMEHIGDKRYNVPKLPPTAKQEAVDTAINENPIYREVRNKLKDDESRRAQDEQVAYGLDKYPETLNAASWSTLETIDHIQGELVDTLHYISLLKVKLWEAIQKENDAQ